MREPVERGQQHRGGDRGEQAVGQGEQYGAGQAADGRGQGDRPVLLAPRGHERRRQGGEQQEQGQLRPPLAGDQLDDAEAVITMPAVRATGRNRPRRQPSSHSAGRVASSTPA